MKKSFFTIIFLVIAAMFTVGPAWAGRWSAIKGEVQKAILVRYPKNLDIAYDDHNWDGDVFWCTVSGTQEYFAMFIRNDGWVKVGPVSDWETEKSSRPAEIEVQRIVNSYSSARGEGGAK